MRILISCMTRNIPYRIALLYGIWFKVLCTLLHVHFRRGVALVGKFFYWALLIPSWDHISGAGQLPVDNCDALNPGVR